MSLILLCALLVIILLYLYPLPLISLISRTSPITSLRRKVAIATWSSAHSASMLGSMKFRTDALMGYLERYNRENSSHVTLSHIIGKAFASALSQHRHWNCRILFGYLVPKESIDVCYLVHVAGEEKNGTKRGADLAKMKIEDADAKTLAQISSEMRQKVTKLRKNQDADYNQTKSVLRMLPLPLVKFSLTFFGWVAGALGWEIPLLGIKEKFPFGSCVVTNVAGFNLQTAYAPVTPYTHSPVYLCVGRAEKEAVVEEGADGKDAVVIRTILTVSATVDHRHFDGAQMGVIAETMRKVIEHPEEHAKEFNL